MHRRHFYIYGHHRSHVAKRPFLLSLLVASLLTIWSVQLSLLLGFASDGPTSNFTKVYGGPAVMLALSLVSFLSVAVGRPWIYQMAVDNVEDKTLWKR